MLLKTYPETRKVRYEGDLCEGFFSRCADEDKHVNWHKSCIFHARYKKMQLPVPKIGGASIKISG